MRRIGLGMVVAIATALLTAVPAFAHAALLTTEPASGSVVDNAPNALKMSFSEGVDLSLGSVTVVDASGDPIKTGSPEQSEGRSEEVSVPLSGLGDGTYVVNWRFISEDSHPVRGAFTFAVGAGAIAPGDLQAPGQGLVDADGDSTPVSIVFGIARFASFASLIVLIGGLAFLLGLWPTGRSHARVRRLLWRAWAASIVFTLAGIALQGVHGAGLPLTDVYQWSVIDGVLNTKFGKAWLVRLILLIVAAPLLARVLKRDPSVSAAMIVVLGAMGAAILAAGSLAGHPGAEDLAILTVAMDTTHFAAVSFWLGGLAMLSLVLRLKDTNKAGGIASRFSRLAFAAVAVIVATGTFQGWWMVRSLDAATGTTYGRLLLIKVGLFGGMLGFAYASRAWVAKRRAAVDVAEPDLVSVGPGAMTAQGPGIKKLRRSVVREIVFAVGILAITSALVNTIPARTAAMSMDSGGPFAKELHAAKVRIDVKLDPAAVGPNALDIQTFTHSGEVTDVEELEATLTLPDKDIGPLEVPLEQIGPGHFTVKDFPVPLPGGWVLEVEAQISEFERATASTEIEVR